MSHPASLQLPTFFSDHMVIQRDQPVKVFGTASPASRIAVSLASEKKSTSAGKDGRWEVALPSLPAGGPHTLVVKSGRRIRRIRDVVIGDLWFCSGQSNMEWLLSMSLRADQAVRTANHPLIRQFCVERRTADTPAADVAGRWQVCEPAAAGNFTAVGYYFAREIHRRTRIPVGLIKSSWGGTAIEAWLPGETIQGSPHLRPLLRREKSLERSDRLIKSEYKEWERKYVSVDPGNQNAARGWSRADFDDKTWARLKVPGCWEGQGLEIDGAVWFRRSVKIPSAWRGKRLLLELGQIDDFDQTYFNGVKIGSMGSEVMNSYKIPRRYTVSADLAACSQALIAVRIFDRFGTGGFTGSNDALKLSCLERPEDPSIPLSGRWRYAIEWSVDRPSPVPQPPALPEARAKLSRLYNGMVHPFVGFPVKGILWYQGESNVSRAAHYGESFVQLIRSWRKHWNEQLLPFYFVQLANFKFPPKQPGEDCWAELREAQTSALSLPATGMAVAIDLGDRADIHPRNKRDVGIRLANMALDQVYGCRALWRRPELKTLEIKNQKLVLTFADVGEGLRTSNGGPIKGFAIAEKDFVWTWASATRTGRRTIVLTSEKVKKPVAVRHGWATNPDCNVVNSHGMPLAPFRSDRQPLSTEGVLWPF